MQQLLVAADVAEEARAAAVRRVHILQEALREQRGLFHVWRPDNWIGASQLHHCPDCQEKSAFQVFFDQAVGRLNEGDRQLPQVPSSSSDFLLHVVFFFAYARSDRI